MPACVRSLLPTLPPAEKAMGDQGAAQPPADAQIRRAKATRNILPIWLGSETT